MKIGVLTSSRADYGIYRPLLMKMREDNAFDVEIIAFGSHTSDEHGYTVSEIYKDGFSNVYTIASLLKNDDQQGIANSYALTALKFADFWAAHQYDLVLCLGDRFEMSAAVQAGIPYLMTFAHLHGGETTLGAIDNIYRHQMTLASVLHFASTDVYAEKIATMLGSSHGVHSVGSMSLDGIEDFEPREFKAFCNKWNIPEAPFVLATFHPETVAADDNVHFAVEMRQALDEICRDVTVVITMPNADSLGNEFRKQLHALHAAHPDRIILVENFGKYDYFSAMAHCAVLLGNSSSGIIEAASFGKYVVDVGDRQKGRATSENVISTAFRANDIVSAYRTARSRGSFTGSNVYKMDDTVDRIINVIKSNENL